MAGNAFEQDDDEVIAQINIIPFVDIALVLLIIATIPEPKRGMVDNLADTAPAPSMWEVAKLLLRDSSSRRARAIHSLPKKSSKCC